MILTQSDYDYLHANVFRADYSGYKPAIVEIPNGDSKLDNEKRYAHVATKYFSSCRLAAALWSRLARAHETALRIAASLGLPLEFMPDIRYGALRVLEYPAGAISNRHEDFDLFTVMCFRSEPEHFVADDADEYRTPARHIASIVNEHAHIGQLGTEIGLGAATPHEVRPSARVQQAIVYFAIPDHNAILPSGVTVRDWLSERMARSRTEFKGYR